MQADTQDERSHNGLQEPKKKQFFILLFLTFLCYFTSYIKKKTVSYYDVEARYFYPIS